MNAAPVSAKTSAVSPGADPAGVSRGISLDRAAAMVTLNGADSSREWKFNTGYPVLSSPCVGPDGTVYVGSDDHTLYALKNGILQQQFITGGKVQSSPCRGPGGMIYVGSDDHRVHAFHDPLQASVIDGDEVAPGPVLSADEDEVTIDGEWIIAGDVKLRVNDR